MKQLNWEKNNNNNNEPVGAFLNILLVLDPARRLAPLAVLADAVKLVELHEDLVGGVIVHLFQGLVRYPALLAPANLYRRIGGFVAAHTARIVAAMGLEVVDVELLEGFRLVGLDADAAASCRAQYFARQARARALAP